MDPLTVVVSAVIGAVIAYLGATLLSRRRMSAVESEKAVLTERLNAQIERAETLQKSVEQKNAEAAALQESLRAEGSLRAAAQEAASRIPELQEAIRQREAQRDELQNISSDLKSKISELETAIEKERKNWQEKFALLEEAKTALLDSFKALSSEALKSNNDSFLQLAKQHLEKFQESAKGDLEKRQQAIDGMVKPIQERLGQFDNKLGELEKSRVGAYKELATQVESMMQSQLRLQTETTKLTKALSSPTERGNWGEFQLRRVVELAGMLEHCDFAEQESVVRDGQTQRPDMVVRMPGGTVIAVDAKAPRMACIEALEAPDEAMRQAKFAEHARQVRQHVQTLIRRAYWEQFKDQSVEAVILFLPGEMYLSAVWEYDRPLIEEAWQNRVIIATPMNLIGLLKAIAFGWRQEALAQNAQQISDLGRELYERLAKCAEHWVKTGRSLDAAVENYNNAIGSFESRVLTTARKFVNLKVVSQDHKGIPETIAIDKRSRQLQAPELD